jgi:hypothetical protein
MANVQEYVRWRGDLTFDTSPFNTNDNLALSALAYLDLEEIVPAPGSRDRLGRRGSRSTG